MTVIIDDYAKTDDDGDDWDFDDEDGNFDTDFDFYHEDGNFDRDDGEFVWRW